MYQKDIWLGSLDIISTLLLYNPFWLKMFEHEYIYGVGVWSSCVGVKEEMKLTRLDVALCEVRIAIEHHRTKI